MLIMFHMPSSKVNFIFFLGVEKNFRLLMQSCWFFFSRPFHENFKFLKNCPYDSNEIFYSHSTLYYGPLCAISLNSYGWDVRNIAKINQKWPKNRHFSIFSKTVHTIRTKTFTVIFYTIVWSYVCNFNKFV